MYDSNIFSRNIFVWILYFFHPNVSFILNEGIIPICQTLTKLARFLDTYQIISRPNLVIKPTNNLICIVMKSPLNEFGSNMIAVHSSAKLLS